MDGRRGVLAAIATVLLLMSPAESRPSCGTWFAGNFNMNGCTFDPMRLQSCVRGKRDPCTGVG